MSSGFITESEIEAKKLTRQAEWDKVRKPEDPLGNLHTLYLHTAYFNVAFYLHLVFQSAFNLLNIEMIFTEAPEGPAPDTRSLFDRLQEQKMKKQEDFEEAHKLSK